MKITTRCGSPTVDGLNEALLAKAEAAKVLKTNRVRADTTVVPADVAYPTDSGLLAKGVAKMAKAVERLQAGGLAPRIKTHDRTRLVRARARSIGANLHRRRNEAKDEVKAINADMVAWPRRRSARPVSGRQCSKRASTARRGRPRQAREDRLRPRGHGRHGWSAPPSRPVTRRRNHAGWGTRLVSLHDPDARQIRKGRLGTPVEFGYKAQVVDNEDGVVVHHNVEMGNPADAPMLAPAVERVPRRAEQSLRR